MNHPEQSAPDELTDAEIEAWADGFIRKVALNRPAAIQIAMEAAKFARSRLAQDADERDALRGRLSDLLTRTANALRGEPPPLTLWSWHDLPERAAAARREGVTTKSEIARLRLVRKSVQAEVSGLARDVGRYASGKALEGYSGGYLQAIDDVLLFIESKAEPTTRGYWRRKGGA